jgi:hypothetical protein
METLSNELEEFFSSSFKVRKVFEQVLPNDATEYLLDLIAKDLSHRKFLKITEESEE